MNKQAQLFATGFLGKLSHHSGFSKGGTELNYHLTLHAISNVRT